MELGNRTEAILGDSRIIDAIHGGDLREVERILAAGEASADTKLRENLYEDERESDDDQVRKNTSSFGVVSVDHVSLVLLTWRHKLQLAAVNQLNCTHLCF